MKIRIVIIGLIGVLALTSALFAKTVEITLSEVAVIAPGENEPDQTLGPRICLKFSLPEGLSGKEIGYAGLEINLDPRYMPADSIIIFETFLLASDWNENSRWNDFANPGGDVDSAYYTGHSFKFGSGNVTEINITEMAKRWNSDIGHNYGLILIPRDTEFNSFRAFRYSPELLRGMITLKIIVPGR